MAVRPSLLGLAVLLAPLSLCAQSTQDLAKIMERLDRLEQENRRLTDELRELRTQLGTPASSSTSVEEKLDIHEKRIEEAAQTKVETSQKFPVRLTGMALFNAFSNSKQSGTPDYPIVASPTAAAHSGATFRQTVIGLEFTGPQAILGAKVRGSAYMDFTAGTAGAPELKLRTADIEIAWKSRSVTAGLEKPIFNPREPSSLAQVGLSPLTGAGNLWLWLPQVRVEQDLRFAPASGLRAQLGVLQTREIGPYTGTAPTEAARPALEGRFNFYHNLDDNRRLEFATGFHTSTTHASGRSIPSSLYSFDWFFNPLQRVEFSGVFYSGRNVAHLGSGLRQGFAIYKTYAEAVESKGGWGQLTLHTFPRLDFHLFTGQIDDGNAQLDKGFIGKNLLFGGNAYFRLAPNVLVGMEATQLRTVYIGQGVRINNHYDLALAYLF